MNNTTPTTKVTKDVLLRKMSVQLHEVLRKFAKDNGAPDDFTVKVLPDETVEFTWEVEKVSDAELRKALLRDVIRKIEAAHFRTYGDSGANEKAQIVHSALRAEAGLPYLSNKDLPKWDGREYVVPENSRLLREIEKREQKAFTVSSSDN